MGSTRSAIPTISAMSNGAEPGKGSHNYRLPYTSAHDRHIQNIIDHTTTLFPDYDYQFSRFQLPSSTNESDIEPEGDQDLDDFGKLAGQDNYSEILEVPNNA